MKEEKIPEELEVLDIELVKNPEMDAKLSDGLHSISPNAYLGNEAAMNGSDSLDIKPFYLTEQKKLLKAIRKEKQAILNVKVKTSGKKFKKALEKQNRKKNKEAKNPKHETKLGKKTSMVKKKKKKKKKPKIITLKLNKEAGLNLSQGNDNFTVMHGDLGAGHSDVMEYHFNGRLCVTFGNFKSDGSDK